jgi:hypothetical protein
MQSQAKAYPYIPTNTAQPQFQYINTPINNYMNDYHTIELQPHWTYQQNQIQAQGFQTRNEYCLGNHANSNYYYEHQIRSNLISKEPQYVNKSIPKTQSKEQEISKFRNDYYTEDEETDKSTSRSSPLNSTCIDDSSINTTGLEEIRKMIRMLNKQDQSQVYHLLLNSL